MGIYSLIWPVFELVRDFINIHLIRKFQEQPIKTKGVMVMTILNLDVGFTDDEPIKGIFHFCPRMDFSEPFYNNK